MDIEAGFTIAPRSREIDLAKQLTPLQFKVWRVLVCHANWRDKEWWDGHKTITIKRGQLLTTTRNLKVFCGRSTCVSSVFRALKVLQKVGEIETQPSREHTLITLCNYEYYANLNIYLSPQGETPEGTQMKHRWNTDETQMKRTKDIKALRHEEEKAFSRTCGHVDNLVNGLAKEKDINREGGK